MLEHRHIDICDGITNLQFRPCIITIDLQRPSVILAEKQFACNSRCYDNTKLISDRILCYGAQRFDILSHNFA